jgi:hypothetical protein
MSPEYVVTKNEKTRRSEIQVNLLDGENSKELREEIIIAHIAEDHLKYNDLFNTQKTLERVLPPEIANGFMKALIDGKEETFVAFKKIEEEKYQITDTNLPSNNNKSNLFQKNSDFLP